MRFTAIDFETANSSPLSACSVGVSVFENGVPVKEWVSYIKPPQQYGKFNWYNIRIHGIKPDMVENAPSFGELWTAMREDVENQLIVCHNAMFDTAVLVKLLNFYKIPVPEFSYVCTVKISQKLWPDMQNHKLDTVSRQLGIHLNHHEALSDSRACGYILACAEKQLCVENIEELAQIIGMRVGKITSEENISCSTAEEIRKKIESQKKKDTSRRRYFAQRSKLKAASAAGQTAKEGGANL